VIGAEHVDVPLQPGQRFGVSGIELQARGRRFIARIDEVPGNKPVVALCRSGRRSAKAVTILKEHGVEKVASLHGGLVKLLISYG
jgi:rhodanese-related sulfurtransferase